MELFCFIVIVITAFINKLTSELVQFLFSATHRMLYIYEYTYSVRLIISIVCK